MHKFDNKSIETTSFNSLLILGIIAMSIGILAVVVGVYLYDYKVFHSISESATTPLTTSMILPFCLGAMAVFFAGYSGYDKKDFICSKIMATGAFIVAMFPCWSDYVTEPRIGMFAMSVHSSTIIHYIGAAALFLTFIYWVAFQFTKSNVLKPTGEKLIRNRVYKTCAMISLSGIILTAIAIFTGERMWVMAAEEAILLPLGFAVVVKAGVLLRDT